jgi:putative ABC transport system substrate-binding protein
MTAIADPVGLGLVGSLSHPGGNLTGVSLQTGGIRKQLQFLKEIAPQVSRVALLLDSSIPANAVGLDQLRPAASTLGVSLA